MSSKSLPPQVGQPLNQPPSSPSWNDEQHLLIAEAAQRARHHRYLVYSCRLVFVAAVLVGWEFASGQLVPQLFISRPTVIVDRLISWISSGILVRHVLVTLQEALGGFALGTFFGVVAGVALARIRLLGEVLNPFLVALYGTPKLALVPLLILWFGIAMTMKLALAAIIVFFLVFYNTYQGVQAVPQPLLNVLRVMGGSRRQLLSKIILPSAALWVFTGLRISVPYALSGAVVGEIVASNVGLGYLVQVSASQLDSAGLFAGLIVIMLLAFLLHLAVEAAQSFFVAADTDEQQPPIV